MTSKSGYCKARSGANSRIAGISSIANSTTELGTEIRVAAEDMIMMPSADGETSRYRTPEGAR
jgi:hypothetical protein